MSAAGESGLCIVIATSAGGQRIAELEAEIDTLQRQTGRWARSQQATLRRAA
jgi:hypothetical protein